MFDPLERCRVWRPRQHHKRVFGLRSLVFSLWSLVFGRWSDPTAALIPDEPRRRVSGRHDDITSHRDGSRVAPASIPSRTIEHPPRTNEHLPSHQPASPSHQQGATSHQQASPSHRQGATSHQQASPPRTMKDPPSHQQNSPGTHAVLQ